MISQNILLDIQKWIMDIQTWGINSKTAPHIMPHRTSQSILNELDERLFALNLNYTEADENTPDY